MPSALSRLRLLPQLHGRGEQLHLKMPLARRVWTPFFLLEAMPGPSCGYSTAQHKMGHGDAEIGLALKPPQVSEEIVLRHLGPSAVARATDALGLHLRRFCRETARGGAHFAEPSPPPASPNPSCTSRSCSFEGGTVRVPSTEPRRPSGQVLTGRCRFSSSINRRESWWIKLAPSKDAKIGPSTSFDACNARACHPGPSHRDVAHGYHSKLDHGNKTFSRTVRA